VDVVRFVDGSEVMPRGRHVLICEGDGEVVLQVDLSAPPGVLLDALTRTVTNYAQTRWMYIGGVKQVERRAS
jgi:hypothetical protein